ncbi:MAG: hypothetical protein AAF668_11375 [Pseudomonadota bacterium]
MVNFTEAILAHIDGGGFDTNISSIRQTRKIERNLLDPPIPFDRGRKPPATMVVYRCVFWR